VFKNEYVIISQVYHYKKLQKPYKYLFSIKRKIILFIFIVINIISAIDVNVYMS